MVVDENFRKVVNVRTEWSNIDYTGLFEWVRSTVPSRRQVRSAATLRRCRSRRSQSQSAVALASGSCITSASSASTKMPRGRSARTRSPSKQFMIYLLVRLSTECFRFRDRGFDGNALIGQPSRRTEKDTCYFEFISCRWPQISLTSRRGCDGKHGIRSRSGVCFHV